MNEPVLYATPVWTWSSLAKPGPASILISFSRSDTPHESAQATQALNLDRLKVPN